MYCCFSSVPSKRVSFKQPQLCLSEIWRMMLFHTMSRLHHRYSKPFLPCPLNGTVGYACTRKLNVGSFYGTETNSNETVCIHSIKPCYSPEVGGCLPRPYEELFLAWTNHSLLEGIVWEDPPWSWSTCDSERTNNWTDWVVQFWSSGTCPDISYFINIIVVKIPLAFEHLFL